MHLNKHVVEKVPESEDETVEKQAVGAEESKAEAGPYAGMFNACDSRKILF